MIQVAFYDTAEDSVFDFAVIIAKKDGNDVFIGRNQKHRP